MKSAESGLLLIPFCHGNMLTQNSWEMYLLAGLGIPLCPSRRAGRGRSGDFCSNVCPLSLIRYRKWSDGPMFKALADNRPWWMPGTSLCVTHHLYRLLCLLFVWGGFLSRFSMLNQCWLWFWVFCFPLLYTINRLLTSSAQGLLLKVCLFHLLLFPIWPLVFRWNISSSCKASQNSLVFAFSPEEGEMMSLRCHF